MHELVQRYPSSNTQEQHRHCSQQEMFYMFVFADKQDVGIAAPTHLFCEPRSSVQSALTSGADVTPMVDVWFKDGCCCCS